MVQFVEEFYPGSNLETFFESCGIADLITTCYGGRNKRVCEAYVKSGGKVSRDSCEAASNPCIYTDFGRDRERASQWAERSGTADR